MYTCCLIKYLLRYMYGPLYVTKIPFTYTPILRNSLTCSQLLFIKHQPSRFHSRGYSCVLCVCPKSLVIPSMRKRSETIWYSFYQKTKFCSEVSSWMLLGFLFTFLSKNLSDHVAYSMGFNQSPAKNEDLFGQLLLFVLFCCHVPLPKQSEFKVGSFCTLNQR